MTAFAEKVLALDRALAAIPHAFGGALALAWCTEQARGTIDIDLNVFVAADSVAPLLDALPGGIEAPATAVAQLTRDGQTRLWWERTPVDLFLNTTPFHEEAATRVVRREFGGVALPFLSCADLAVFKAFFDRTKDWADMEAMAAAGQLDVQRIAGVLVTHLGVADHRVARLLSLVRPV